MLCIANPEGKAFWCPFDSQSTIWNTECKAFCIPNATIRSILFFVEPSKKNESQQSAEVFVFVLLPIWDFLRIQKVK
jgi:hypothetical protein